MIPDSLFESTVASKRVPSTPLETTLAYDLPNQLLADESMQVEEEHSGMCDLVLKGGGDFFNMRRLYS